MKFSTVFVALATAMTSVTALPVIDFFAVHDLSPRHGAAAPAPEVQVEARSSNVTARGLNSTMLSARSVNATKLTHLDTRSLNLTSLETRSLNLTSLHARSAPAPLNGTAIAARSITNGTAIAARSTNATTVESREALPKVATSLDKKLTGSI